jgi:fucose permease
LIVGGKSILPEFYSKQSMWCLAYYFFILGCIYGGWASRLPEIQLSVNASDLELGLALLSSSIGAFSAIFISPFIIRRFSSKTAVIATTVGYAGVVPLLGLLGTLPHLCMVLFMSGAVAAVLDVAMNMQAVRYEQLKGTRFISRLHAIYSIGVVGGGMLGSVLSSLPLRFQLTLTSLVVLIGAFLLKGGLLKQDSEERPDIRKERKSSVFSPEIKLLAVVLFAAALCEGALVEWCAKYLRQELRVPLWTAPLGVSAFSCGMVAGRLSGDWSRARFHFSTLLVGGTTITALSLFLLSLTTSLAIALLAATLCGLGLSVLVPIAYAAAGNIKAGERTEDALAQLTAVGYSALLLGPALIGGASEYLGLRGAFALLPVLLLAGTVSGWRLRVRLLRTLQYPAV